MPNEVGPGDVKALYEYAINTYSGGNLPYAIRLFQGIVELHHPFYTPFSLGVLADAYRKLNKDELELDTLKRVVELPKEQQLFLDPGFVAGCYQKTGDLKTAKSMLASQLDLDPDEPRFVSNLAEICLIDGDLKEAERLADGLSQRVEPGYQVLGRMIKGFSLAIRRQYAESAKELLWVGQYIASAGPAVGSVWDYRDMQTLLGKLGHSTRMAEVLINALTVRTAPAEFAPLWAEVSAVGTVAPPQDARNLSA
jgi:tetratricopeptide (TPR) repeat protein